MTVVNESGSARTANSNDNEAKSLCHSVTSYVSTPEHLATINGQLFLYRRKAQMVMSGRQLSFLRAGKAMVIPFAAIRDLSIGHYPRVMHPAGLDFISVTYDEGGQTQRLYFSPKEMLFGLPSQFNRFVAEWFDSIRAAITSATGTVPGNTPANQLGTPSSSFVLIVALWIPILIGPLFSMFFWLGSSREAREVPPPVRQLQVLPPPAEVLPPDEVPAPIEVSLPEKS